MTSDADTVALLERALDQTAAIIAAIPASQAGLATPCPGWDVAALVRHLTGQDLRNFLVSARGEAVEWQAPADELGQDWAADFRDRAARLLAVWRAADLGQQLPMPGGGQAALGGRADQQIAELAMHGWDLAVATGQQTEPDPALAEHALRWSRRMLRPEFRGPGRAFGPEVPVPPDAPVYQQLAGWFGRDPNWTPPGNTADQRPLPAKPAAARRTDRPECMPVVIPPAERVGRGQLRRRRARLHTPGSRYRGCVCQDPRSGSAAGRVTTPASAWLRRGRVWRSGGG